MKTSLRVITILVILSMTLVACGGTASKPATAAPNAKVNLTFWWWAESDAPGADAWMTETVAAYKQIHPNVTINIVPQSTDTLISAFQSAVAAVCEYSCMILPSSRCRFIRNSNSVRVSAKSP